MFKKVFLISLLMLLLIPPSCKLPTTPDVLDEECVGEIEIMYVRVKEIVYPNNPDPNLGAEIYHYKYGGKNSSRWVPIEENKWIASAFLNCDPQPYFISVGDGKVSYHPVAEKLFVRVKREGASWVELTCIVSHPFDSNGKAAKVIFNKGQLQIPSGC